MLNPRAQAVKKTLSGNFLAKGNKTTAVTESRASKKKKALFNWQYQESLKHPIYSDRRFQSTTLTRIIWSDWLTNEEMTPSEPYLDQAPCIRHSCYSCYVVVMTLWQLLTDDKLTLLYKIVLLGVVLIQYTFELDMNSSLITWHHSFLLNRPQWLKLNYLLRNLNNSLIPQGPFSQSPVLLTACTHNWTSRLICA